MKATQPITRAYRLDLADRRDAFGPRDDAWLTVGSLLEHAAAIVAEDEAAAQVLVREACDHAASVVDPARLAQLRTGDWQQTGSSPLDAVVVLSDHAHDSGAIHVAASLLDAAHGAQPALDPLTGGRLAARRARAAWRLGWLGEAQDRCADLLALGEREREPELVARAWVGFGAVAQMRGNYPEMERCARELESIAAKIGHVRLLRASRASLMVVAGVRRDFEQALKVGWQLYSECIGDPVQEGEILQNLAQVLLEAGYPDAARAAFARIIWQALPPRFMLGSLGGLALASSRTNKPETVRWATDQVSLLDTDGAPQYSLAYALLECAAACEAVGESARATTARNRASELAETFHFHEIAYHASAADQAPASLDAPATTVTRQVVELEPAGLPERVALLPA